MLSPPSTPSLAQLCPSSLPLNTTSTARDYCHGSMSPFTPPEHSFYTISETGLCSEAPSKTVLQSSGPLNCLQLVLVTKSQPTTTPTSPIWQPSPSESKAANPLPRLSWVKQQQISFPRAQPQPKNKKQHFSRSCSPVASHVVAGKESAVTMEQLSCHPSRARRLPTGDPQYAVKN